MSWRGIATLLLVAAAVGFERFGYFGSRVALTQALHAYGLRPSSISQLYSLSAWGSAIASLVGGAIAIAAGARATATIGAAFAALGMLLFAVGVPPMVSVGVVALGTGLFRPCPMAAAAEVVLKETSSSPHLAPSSRRFALVASVATGSHMLANVAAFTAPMLTGSVLARAGNGVTFGISFVAELFAFLLMGAAALAGTLARKTDESMPVDPYRAMPAPVAPSASSRELRAVMGIAILLGPALLLHAGTSMATLPYTASMSAKTLGAMYSINPLVVTIVSGVVAMIWLGASADFWSLTPVRWIGVGAVVLGVGLAPLAAADSMAIGIVGTMIVAFGEALALPLLLVHPALAVRQRFTALLLAVWSLLAYGASSLGAAAGQSSARSAMLAVCAVLLLACGVPGAALARAVHRRFFGEEGV